MSLELVSWLSLMEKDYKALPKRKKLLPKCVCYLMHKHGITVTHIHAYKAFASTLTLSRLYYYFLRLGQISSSALHAWVCLLFQ